MNALMARPQENTIAANTAAAQPRIGPRRNRSASQPMGNAPSTMNAPAGRADEHDDAVADAEGVADVRRQHLERRRLELVGHLEEHEDREGEEAADGQALAQRHLLAADTGQQVVGEQDDLLRFLLLQLASLGLGVEQLVHETGRRHAAVFLLANGHAVPLSQGRRTPLRQRPRTVAPEASIVPFVPMILYRLFQSPHRRTVASSSGSGDPGLVSPTAPN